MTDATMLAAPESAALPQPGQDGPDSAGPAAAAPPTKLLATAAAQDKRSKKQQGKKRNRGGAPAQEEVALTAAQADHLRIVRVEGRKDPGNDDRTSPVVLLSRAGKAPQLQLSDDRRSVSGVKGFRTVRATHGAHAGTWYCEAIIDTLGPTGHVRLGWVTRKAELQAPVGFDKHGFAYRDVEGSKVHQGLREPYGQGFGDRDVVGLFLHMPEGGRPLETHDRAVTRYKGALYFVDEPEPAPQPLVGSRVAFTVNGALQGVAYADILEGTYYPAASLYTLPSQPAPATITFNFGPDFKYPPPQVEGCPPAQPVCLLAQLAAQAAVEAGSGAKPARTTQESASPVPQEPEQATPAGGLEAAPASGAA